MKLRHMLIGAAFAGALAIAGAASAANVNVEPVLRPPVGSDHRRQFHYGQNMPYDFGAGDEGCGQCSGISIIEYLSGLTTAFGGESDRLDANWLCPATFGSGADCGGIQCSGIGSSGQPLPSALHRPVQHRAPDCAE